MVRGQALGGERAWELGTGGAAGRERDRWLGRPWGRA